MEDKNQFERGEGGTSFYSPHPGSLFFIVFKGLKGKEKTPEDIIDEDDTTEKEAKTKVVKKRSGFSWGYILFTLLIAALLLAAYYYGVKNGSSQATAKKPVTADVSKTLNNHEKRIGDLETATGAIDTDLDKVKTDVQSLQKQKPAVVMAPKRDQALGIRKQYKQRAALNRSRRVSTPRNPANNVGVVSSNDATWTQKLANDANVTSQQINNFEQQGYNSNKEASF